MKKIIPFMLLVLIIIPIFQGCDFKDIDRRLFIVAIGIDKSDNPDAPLSITFKAAITNQSITSQGGNGQGSPGNSELYTIKGESVSRILRLLKTETSLEPDFSHMKLFLFSKELVADVSIKQFIEFFTRRRDFQNSAWVAVSNVPTTVILNEKSKEENFPGNSFFMKLHEGVESEYTHRIMLYRMFSDLFTAGVSPSCPVFELKDNKLAIENVAIFTDGKLKLELTQEESKIFNMLYRSLDVGHFQAKVPKNNELIEVGINKCTGKFKLKKGTKEQVSYDVDIKGNGVLESSTEDESLNSASQLISEEIKKDTISLLKKLQENKVDPYSLEIAYAAAHPSYNISEDWLTEKFPNIKFNVNVTFQIIESGTLR